MSTRSSFYMIQRRAQSQRQAEASLTNNPNHGEISGSHDTINPDHESGHTSHPSFSFALDKLGVQGEHFRPDHRPVAGEIARERAW